MYFWRLQHAKEEIKTEKNERGGTVVVVKNLALKNPKIFEGGPKKP